MKSRSGHELKGRLESGMDLEELLHSLWDLLAERGNSELEKRIRDLLKKHATDEWLRSCGQILRGGRLDQAKSLVSDFLRDHPDLSGIRKKLELILLFERRKSSLSPVRKTCNREQLLQTVNSLASSGKLVAAEELLEEALAEEADPELLDLLGRVYMLQRRPQQAAAVMQRALLARRQQTAFIEQPPQADHATELDDEVVTAADLDYIASDAGALAGLEATSGWQGGVVEPVKSQPDEPHSADPGHGIEASHGNDTVSLPVSVPATEDQRAPSAEGRKTLSLGKPRKSADVVLTPQGTKILVRQVPHSKSSPFTVNACIRNGR
jgi:tetratricopeptide (TPR) repeat protein